MRSVADAPLGGTSVDHFLAHHWQRRPLMIRNAIEDFRPPLEPDALLSLASRDEVESRLITRRGRRWTLEHGPFDTDNLPPRTQSRWTLLVQGVDLHDDAAAALLQRFAFLPHARVDDLMISYATDAGGVGPHVDSYDVFLLQSHGRRRWRIGRQTDYTFELNLPLKILKQFEPTDEWVLEPGDMLYLPPGWAHDGEALGECTTCSIGFRAPSRVELLRAFLADAAERIEDDERRFRDAPRTRPARPGMVPDDLRAFAREAIGRWKPKPQQVDDFLGRFLTEPKANVFFDAPGRALTSAAFDRAAAKAGIALDRRTRMLAGATLVHINGESVRTSARERAVLARLADARRLTGADVTAALARPGLGAQLYDWYRAGWLHVARLPEPADGSRRPARQSVRRPR